MRFYYYYPTFDKPSGGNKQLRLQATLLRELGVETYLLRDKAFFERGGGFDDNTYYGVAVDTADFSFEAAESHLTQDDVIIIPEVVLNRVLSQTQSWRVRLAVNNQNGFYGLRYGPSRRLCRQKLEFVIANAPYVAALSNHFYGIPSNRIFHVPHWILRSPFDCSARNTPAQLAVAYMPRKLPEVVNQVKQLVINAEPNVPWVEIHNLPEEQVSQAMKNCQVFFAAQDLEGCPLTALEAMSCHAIVAGFPGTAWFPHPYATRDNGFWAEDRNVHEAANAVVCAIKVARDGGQPYQEMLEQGQGTARKFSKETVLGSLQDLVHATQNKNYSERKPLSPRLGMKGWLQAGRLMYDYDRFGRTGKFVSALSQAAKRISVGKPKP